MRKDDETHRLAIRKTKTSTRLHLTIIHRHNARADYLGNIGSRVQAEGDDSHQYLIDIRRCKHHVVDDKQLHHGWRASHDGEVQLTEHVRNLPVALTFMTCSDNGYQRSEYHGKDDGEEGDDECIAQTLQQILITVVIYEAGFKLIYHSRLISSCFHIAGIHHDYLSHIGIGICKSDILLPFRSNRDAGNTRICLTSLYRGDDGIKLHIENLYIHAQYIADGICHIHVDAHNLAILVIFERLEGSVGGKTETRLQAEFLQRFRSHLLHLRSLWRISHGYAPFQMAVDDGIDDAILFQDTDGTIDGLLQLCMILSNADGERRRIEGFGQDTERWVHPLECLGWRLIGHHAVYLTLQECLDGIGSLVIPFYLGTATFLFQLRS